MCTILATKKKTIKEIMIFIEPNCIACEQVLRTIRAFQKEALVERLVVIDRSEDPATCRHFGIVVFPATLLNGRLAFYGEFSLENLKEYLR